jgi:hypothetical protein
LVNCPEDSLGDGFSSHDPDLSQVEGVSLRSGGQGKDGVSIEERMGGIDGSGQSILSHLSHLGGLSLMEPGIGGHDPKRGILIPEET